MNLRKIFSGILLAGVLLSITACAKSQGFDTASSCIYVTKDGTFKSVLVSQADTSQYTADELRTFAQQEIDSYDDPSSVMIESVKAQDGKLSIIFNYTSSDALVSWSTYSQDTDNAITSISISDIANAVKIAGSSWIDSKGNTVDVGTLGSGTVCINASGNALIQTEGKIAAISGDVAIIDEKKAQISSNNCFIIFK